jgi:hypothetical protein
MRPLRKFCVYDGDEWIDTLRVYEVPCDGMLRYVFRHIEDEDLFVFDDVNELLEAAKRRVVMEKPRLGPCVKKNLSS